MPAVPLPPYAGRVRFVKGHGTKNDFVVLPDLDDQLLLDEQLVRAICDRRSGIGADGVLRVAPAAAALPDTGATDGVRWFMDYRNSDGSLAQMCGNGIRVFARFLVAEGIEPPGRLSIDTRAGVKLVDVPATGDISVEMGTSRRLPDAKVVVAGVAYDAAGWSMGNPHLVALEVAELDSLDLSAPPAVDPPQSFPDGVNIEFVERLGPDHIRLRVYERGSAETWSCGTGACAAAVAAMDVAGERTSYAVDVRGGRLTVGWDADDLVRLTGPAVLVADGDYAP